MDMTEQCGVVKGLDSVPDEIMSMILEHHSSGGQMRMPRQNVKGRGLAIQIIHAGGIDKAFDTSGRVEL